MNKIFGLLFGICLVCAAYWAYPKLIENQISLSLIKGDRI